MTFTLCTELSFITANVYIESHNTQLSGNYRRNMEGGMKFRKSYLNGNFCFESFGLGSIPKLKEIRLQFTLEALRKTTSMCNRVVPKKKFLITRGI